MTPEERAQKIVEDWFGAENLDDMTAELEDAISRAITDALAARERDICRALECVRRAIAEANLRPGTTHLIPDNSRDAIEALVKPEVTG
jgi:hypothetical protein